MKPLILITLLFLCLTSRTVLAQEQQVVVPYTLADRTGPYLPMPK